MVQKGFFIQYKFIVPKSIKHSSYTYQKLFRAIYGYTQTVCKSSGKVYRYRREGILSKTPYLRPGKNCVIIPPKAFNQLTDFFKTGKNPAHYWHVKGDWKAVYYMDEKDLSDAEVTKALEVLLDRSYVLTTSNEHEKIDAEIKVALSSSTVDVAYRQLLLKEAERIVSGPWFKEAHKNSSRLTDFCSDYLSLKGR